jgi:hypothetical protein
MMVFCPRSHRALLAAGVSVALAAPALTAIAQGYPVRPIRFIIPAPPGGAPDALGPRDEIVKWGRVIKTAGIKLE